MKVRRRKKTRKMTWNKCREPFVFLHIRFYLLWYNDTIPKDSYLVSCSCSDTGTGTVNVWLLFLFRYWESSRASFPLFLPAIAQRSVDVDSSPILHSMCTTFNINYKLKIVNLTHRNRVAHKNTYYKAATYLSGFHCIVKKLKWVSQLPRNRACI